MTQKIKDSYQTPAVKVLEVKFEGLICESQGGTQDYNYGNLDEG